MTRPAHLGEIQDTFDKASAFFRAHFDYIQGTSSEPPNIGDLIGLSSFNLDTENGKHSASGTSYSSGSNQEAAASLASIQRELSMATSTKASIYLSHESELQRESTYYDNQGVFLFGVSSGSSTNGSMS